MGSLANANGSTSTSSTSACMILQRFVRQVAGVPLGARRNLFVRPGPMRHRLREQAVIAKAILQNLFESVEVFECDGFHVRLDSSKTPNAASNPTMHSA